jgi:uncharacterized repeat protein (TIGR02543 family)
MSFKHRKSRTGKLLAIMMCVVMVFSLGAGLTFAENEGAPAAQGAEGVLKAMAGDTARWSSNTSGDGKISMTAKDQAITVTFKLTNMATTTAAIDALTAGEYYLYRDKGSLPVDIYPYQFLAKGPVSGRGRMPEAASGAPWKLSDWKVANTSGTLTSTPLFSNFSEDVVMNGSVASVTCTFKTDNLFNGITNADNRNMRTAFLDYTGDYRFEFRDAADAVRAKTTVRFNPYDSYRTMPEIEAEINEAAAYINNPANDRQMYAEVRSLGTTEYGRNMPYIIIAKSKKVLDDYQAFMEQEETNPSELIRKLDAGYRDFQVPVLYSNIHADEINGVDSIMDFMWDLAKEDRIDYQTIDSLKPAGQTQLAAERAAAGADYPAVFGTLKTDEKPTGLGYIRGTSVPATNVDPASVPVNMSQYYNMKNTVFKVDEILKDVFFILVPEENVDGRTLNARESYGGIDLNRDNLFQTQKETKNMTKMIAAWNPVIFWEQHGFVTDFQVEPCTPPHEANFEYDLLAKTIVKAGEAYGNGAISNNPSYNSFRMPLRDYYANGEWYVWDDVSTAYTPEYAMLHGTVAYTVEVPYATEEGNTAMEYGLINNAKFTAENKVEFLRNQLIGYERGIYNIDADSIDPWYEDMQGNVGAEASVFRPKYAENQNYFPEYYVIPNDVDSQRNIKAVSEMTQWLLDSDVKVTTLKSETTVRDASGTDRKLAAGSIVVDMHQAKRNVANVALSNGLKLKNWGMDLYSEPVTAFPEMRGFNCYVITKPGALSGKLDPLAAPAQTKPAKIKTPYTIIMNGSIDATKAVNDLIQGGKSVGFIQSGTYKGHFIVPTADYMTIQSKYTLSVKASAANQPAKVIRDGTVFVLGAPAAEFMGTTPNFYGAKEKPRIASGYYDFNYNNKALSKEMGFRVTTTDLAGAQVIAGHSTLSAAQIDAVKGGKAYVGWGTNAVTSANTLFGPSNLNIGTISNTVISGSNADALYMTEYVADSLVTAAKRYYGDEITYSFGGHSISSVPNGVNVLQRVKGNDILAGSLPANRYAGFLGSIQAFQYKSGNVDVVVYTHPLARKNHQKDDYMLISSAIFNALTTTTDFNPDVSKFVPPAGDYTISLNDGGKVVSSIKRDPGEAYGALPTRTKKGYSFRGWYTAKTGGTKIAATTVFNKTSNQTLYARWTAKVYKTLFKVNGKNVKLKVKSKKYAYGKKFTNLPKPTRKGYTFTGWFTKAKGGTKITAARTNKYAHTFRLYAHWKKK